MKVLLCGCKGYIGFSLAQRLLKQNHVVYGIDNDLRENEVLSKKSISITETDFSYLESQDNFSYSKVDVARDRVTLDNLVKDFLPDSIINLAHVPSAPYSQIDLEHADYTLTNNFNGTNNLLWLMKKYCPESHYITIGTAGEYNHYANIDIEEGYFSFEHKGRQSEECIFPRRPGSIYHTSKVASTYLIDFLSRTWGLKCTDVMQGIVFGLYTDESELSGNYSRFDTDECFGTVINRFCAQAVLDIPLTIYGKGKHKRSFISLNDSIQALMIALNNPPKRGVVQVWNQLSEWHSMEDIADLIVDVSKSHSINATKQFIPTPRNESTDDHYYKFVTDKLASLGYNPTRTIRDEIDFILGLIKGRLDDESSEILRQVVLPTIKWN